jgi:accessory gene regulator B
MNKITEAITEVLVKNLVTEEEKRELCIYGIGLMISSVIDILLILIISAFLHRFIETLIYLFAFIPLRLYAVGYHSGSEAKCLGIFIGVFMLFILTIELLPIFLHFWVILFSIVVGCVGVMLFAPIENCNMYDY